MNDTIDVKARKLKLTIHLPQMGIVCTANRFWRLSQGPIDLVSLFQNENMLDWSGS